MDSQTDSEAKLVQVKKPNKALNFVKDNFLLISIIVSIFVGFGIGIGIRNAKFKDPDAKSWFILPGQLFIRSLELLIVPVVFVGVIAATSSLSAKSNIRITLIGIGLCMLTHVVATLCGLVGSIILINASEKNESEDEGSKLLKQKTIFDIIADILRNLIPKNIVKATTSQELTRYYPGAENGTFIRRVEYIDGTNILGILSFGLLIGISASILDKKSEAFREFFKSLNDVIILTLRWLIMVAPIGIASLIIDAVLDIEDFGESFKKIGLFAGICVGVLLFYGILLLALMIFVFIRKNPVVYYLYYFEPMLLAFASTSGAVCIHKAIDVCEKQVKMDPRISRFSIPFFTTLQADGSGIFIVMSCAFLSNYAGVSLSAGDWAVIIIMTSILCLCLPSVPSSSIVTILVVLNAVNVDKPNIALLYTVEWLLDRYLFAHFFSAHLIVCYLTCPLLYIPAPRHHIQS